MFNDNKDENKNYDVNPEDNIPYEVYGIMTPSEKDDEKRYDVNPQNNNPVRIYGIPPFMGETNAKNIKIMLTKSISNIVLQESTFHNLSCNSSFSFDNLEFEVNRISDEIVELSIANNNDFYLSGFFETPVNKFSINKNNSTTITNMVKPTISYEIKIIEIIDDMPKSFL